jgi:hypothetical protein
MNSLSEQIAEAERIFRRPYKSKPRSGRTMRLHWQWAELKKLAEEVRLGGAQNATA